jgi:glutamate racemase
MLKPAAGLTKTGIVAVCATPATLASDRYIEAKHEYLDGIVVIEPDCSEWARLIENDEINQDKIETVVRECLSAKADVIVLGCTHYHWIKSEIEETVAGRAIVLEPSDAISRRVRDLLGL